MDIFVVGLAGFGVFIIEIVKEATPFWVFREGSEYSNVVWELPYTRAVGSTVS